MTRASSNSAAAVAAAPARALALPSILRGRDFRRFWLGESISLIGDQITLIALPLVGVLALHADAAQMGYLGAAALIPNLLFSLHAGAWLDRRGRRREAMIVTALARAASGDVHIDETGDAKVRTASGDQRIGAVGEGSVELQSMSGDITVGVREARTSGSTPAR